jgi:hexosaminidase
MPVSCPILPRPAQFETAPGVFVLTAATVIVADQLNQWNAAYLRELLSPPTGFTLRLADQAAGHSSVIQLHLGGDRAVLGREGYRLTVAPGLIDLEAPEPAGVLYGLQSLRQLLPVEIEGREKASRSDWQVPGCVVTDWPRFAWRGFMLDEGRHFLGKETVLRLLDQLVMQKLNVFHWHLTEDQGWRIEIKAYPKLTEIGSHRQGTTRGFGGRDNGVPHGGFYTQDEIREVVEYASRRNLLVVPEIEFPGHSLAALAAYPELSCTGGPFEVCTHFGILPELYCAGNEAVFTFLQTVLDEILALFPAPFVHIGGDEAPKQRWKKCPKCQERLRTEGLKNEKDLQVYFTNRIAAYLTQRGRRLIGWNQILGKGLETNAIAQWWAGDKQEFLKALEAGHEGIVSAYLETYLDHAHALTPLRRAYRYEPVSPALSADAATRLLGLEAPLWSEFVRSPARLDYQTYPRLMAYAETGWTPRELKDYADFRLRLEPFLERLKRLGVRPAPLREAEPPFYRQWFGIFTIPQPQEKIA